LTSNPVGSATVDRHALERRVVVVNPQANVFEVVAAAHSASSFTSGLHGRKKQAHQNADDGNDHQQFDKRECGSISIHLKIPDTKIGKLCVLAAADSPAVKPHRGSSPGFGVFLRAVFTKIRSANSAFPPLSQEKPAKDRKIISGSWVK
jgi:hypothetical protein